jgi:hypothetical protein
MRVKDAARVTEPLGAADLTAPANLVLPYGFHHDMIHPAAREMAKCDGFARSSRLRSPVRTSEDVDPGAS